MKARIKGEKEWKDYKEAFDSNGVFLGLETLGYIVSEEEYCKRLGIEYDPESPFNNPYGQYMSKILPLECFDLFEDEKHLRAQAAIAAMQAILTCNDDEYRQLIACAYRDDEKHTIPNGVAQFAVACADALVKELNRKETNE